MNRRRGWPSLVVIPPNTSHHLLCVCVCVRVLLCLVFDIVVHLGNKVTFYPLSPLTSQVTILLQCHTDHFKSLRARDRINLSYESQKYHRRWGVNPSLPALKVRALGTRPPWTYSSFSSVVRRFLGWRCATTSSVVNAKMTAKTEVRDSLLQMGHAGPWSTAAAAKRRRSRWLSAVWVKLDRRFLWPVRQTSLQLSRHSPGLPDIRWEYDISWGLPPVDHWNAYFV